MHTFTRPAPVRRNSRGTAVWDTAELRAYREAHGVTQEAVSAYMQVPRPNIAQVFESPLGEYPVSDLRAERYFRAVEALAARREKTMAAGAGRLAEIRAQRGGR